MQNGIIQNESLMVRNLSKGNVLAFNYLYKEYSGRLYRFAFGYLKSEAESDELVQEVFTIIWVKRTNLKEELCFKSFLFTIAFNIIKKHFRKRAYLREYLENRAAADLDMQTSHKVIYESLFQYLSILINKLPARRREIFIKSRFDGLSIQEIARELNISHKTVENQLTDALKFIRVNLNNELIQVFFYFSIIFS